VKRLLLLAVALIAVPSATGTVGNGPILLTRTTNVNRGVADLYSVRPDGSQLTLLTTSVLGSVVSPDATKIALFTSADVLVMNADGTGLRTLASYVTGNGGDAILALVWFPDSVRLAVQLRANPPTEFRFFNVMSGEQITVPVYEDGVPLVVRPEQWSPDRTEFVYQTPGVSPQLRVKSVTTGAIRTVADAGSSPVWSPDGQWIAYISRGSAYVVASGGGTPVLLAEAASGSPIYSVGNLFWSPDSSTIAFTVATSNRPEPRNGFAVTNGVFVARADGSSPTLVRNHATVAGWSPAGDALLVYPTHADRGAYPPYLLGYDDLVPGVYFMRPDGRCLTLATEGEALAWLPGGSAPANFRCVDISLEAAAPIVRGLSGVRYTLSITNEGTDDAHDVVLTQQFDSGVRVVSLPEGCSSTSDAITCRLSRLAPGATAEFAPFVRPPNPVTFTSEVTVRSADRDSDPKSNSRDTATRIYPCWIAGTDFPETLRGTNAGEEICARAGNDTIYGLGGNDTIDAGLGADTIYPGAGRDRVKAGEGGDTVYARDGQRDVITCGRGVDLVIADRLDVVGRDCDFVRRG
jgi:hypothetical protein